ncbi:MAG: AraC family transcriptional regulator [Microbacterium sp.]
MGRFTVPDLGRGAAIRVDTTDVDDARAVGGAVYHPHTLRFARGDAGFGMHLRATATGPILTGTLSYDLPVEVRAAEFLDSYQVNLALHGEVLMTYGRREQPATTDIGAVHGPIAPSIMAGWARPAQLLGVKFAREDLERELAEAIGAAPSDPIGFRGWLDTRTPDGRVWTTLARRIAWWSRMPHPCDGDVQRTLPTAILAALLHAAEHDFSPDLALARRTPRVAATMALAAMHARAGDAMSMTDLADEVGVSVRALEKQFRERWDRSPAEMLTGIRLDYARRTLSDPTSRATRVGDVSRRWGLPHPGRFASRYAERFGEEPSTTLAYARNRASGATRAR